MKNESKKLGKHYRQGDVLVMAVSQIPDNLTKTKIVRLANGEVTGHMHEIDRSDSVGYAESETALSEYFEVTSDFASLTHQEHAPITFERNKYRSVIQTEYTPKEMVRVQD